MRVRVTADPRRQVAVPRQTPSRATAVPGHQHPRDGLAIHVIASATPSTSLRGPWARSNPLCRNVASGLLRRHYVPPRNDVCGYVSSRSPAEAGGGPAANPEPCHRSPGPSTFPRVPRHQRHCGFTLSFFPVPEAWLEPTAARRPLQERERSMGHGTGCCLGLPSRSR